MVVDCGELEELWEVVAGGEHQHWQDVPDESTLVIMMMMVIMVANAMVIMMSIAMAMTARMVMMMRMRIGTMT